MDNLFIRFQRPPVCIACKRQHGPRNSGRAHCPLRAAALQVRRCAAGISGAFCHEDYAPNRPGPSDAASSDREHARPNHGDKTSRSGYGHDTTGVSGDKCHRKAAVGHVFDTRSEAFRPRSYAALAGINLLLQTEAIEARSSSVDVSPAELRPERPRHQQPTHDFPAAGFVPVTEAVKRNVVGYCANATGFVFGHVHI